MMNESELKEKDMGSDELWNSAEATIEKVLKKLKIQFTKEPGEAKFYGHSLDVLKRKSYYKALNKDEDYFVSYFIRKYLLVHKKVYLKYG